MKTKLRCLSVVAALALLCSSVAIVGCGGGGGGGGNPAAATSTGGSGSSGDVDRGNNPRRANEKTIVVNLPVPAAPAGASVRANATTTSANYKNVKLYNVPFAFDKIVDLGATGKFERWVGNIDAKYIQQTASPKMEYTLKKDGVTITGTIDQAAVAKIKSLAQQIGDEIYVISVDKNPPAGQTTVTPRLAVLNVAGVSETNFVDLMQRVQKLEKSGGKNFQEQLDELAKQLENTTFMVVLDTNGALGVNSLGRYMKGDEVSVKDISRDDGYNFEGWKLDKDENVEEFKWNKDKKLTTFKMKQAEVKLTAQWQEVTGLEFKLLEDKNTHEKSYKVIVAKTDLRKLVIPAKYKDTENKDAPEELPVTAMESTGYGATFPNLEELTIPGSIATITSVFSKCETLAKLNIQEGVKDIDYDAFNGCTNLTEINIPGSVANILRGAFSDCPAVKSIKLGSGTEEISGLLNNNWESLEKIEVAAGNTHFGANGNCLIDIATTTHDLLLGCKKSVIPADVKKIKKSAFSNNKGITNLTIPATVEFIEESAFSGCANLLAISFAEGIKIKSIEGNTFDNCKCLGEITIPAGVETIKSNAFYNCDGLAKVTLKEGLEEIAQYAFYICPKLESINIPDSVKKIDYYAFAKCDGLKSVTIGAGVKSLKNIFASCTNLESVTLATSVVSIGGANNQGSVFSNCSKLQSIHIPESVSFIGEEAFDGCSGLQTISVAPSNKYYQVDGNCLIRKDSKTIIKGVAASTIPSKADLVVTIKHDAFKDSGIKEVTIPKNIAAINSSAFENCASLTKVVIEKDGVTSIGSRVFFNCENLNEITMPETVTSIGNNAFAKSGFKTIDFKHVTSVDNGAFAECESLEKVKLENATTIGRWGSGAFQDCKNLDKVELKKATSIGDNTFARCEKLASIDLPEATEIHDGAFRGCESLTEIKIPKVTHIYSNAFIDCEKLKDITIPDTVTDIDSSAFDGCSSLKKINLAKVTSIDDSAFKDCSSLENVTIPNTVTHIYSDAFNGCSSLTKINIPKTVTSIGNGAFSNCSGLEKITVDGANASSTYYASASCLLKREFNYTWNDDGDQVPTTLVKTELIAGCKNSKIDKIDSNVKKIAKRAFEGCTGLTEITIPANITQIGEDAFKGCTNLATVNYGGTQDEWQSRLSDPVDNWGNRVYGSSLWNDVSASYVTCSDGVVPLQ